MPLYKTLWDDNIWRATVCDTTDEATRILGKSPEVTKLGPAVRNAETEALWAAPGVLFMRNVGVFPPVWVPAHEAGEPGAVPEQYLTS